MTSCATIQQNIDARTYLAKCQYEFAGLKVTGVQFGPGLAIDAVDFEVAVKVTNPTEKDVALDHLTLAFALDKNPVLDLAHNKFTRVATKASAVDPFAVRLPFAGIVKTLGHRPEVVNVRAQLWVTLLVGKDTWETPIVIPVAVDLPIPYDQIDAFVAQKKKELEAQAAAEAKKAADEAAARAAAAAAEAAKAAAAALPPAPSLPKF